jgi:hypothetical protein
VTCRREIENLQPAIPERHTIDCDLTTIVRATMDELCRHPLDDSEVEGPPVKMVRAGNTAHRASGLRELTEQAPQSRQVLVKTGLVKGLF